MDDLPNELLFETLMYLSTDDLLIMKKVLPRIVNDHYFQARHQYTYNSLFDCCKKGLIEGVKMHLLKGSVVDDGMIHFHIDRVLQQFTCQRSWTLLHIAAFYGHIELVHFLIQAGAVLEATDDCSRTPLYLASSNGQTEIVKILIHSGANIHATNYSGWTLLHSSVKNDRIEIVQLLIQAGADLNATDEMGMTPLHWARRTEVIKLLIAAPGP